MNTHICISMFACLFFKNAYTHRGDTHTHTRTARLEQKEEEREKYTIQFYVNGSSMSHDDVLVDRWLMSFSTSCNFFISFCFSFFLSGRRKKQVDERETSSTTTNLNQNFQHCSDRMMTSENQLQREKSPVTYENTRMIELDVRFSFVFLLLPVEPVDEEVSRRF